MGHHRTRDPYNSLGMLCYYVSSIRKLLTYPPIFEIHINQFHRSIKLTFHKNLKNGNGKWKWKWPMINARESPGQPKMARNLKNPPFLGPQIPTTFCLPGSTHFAQVLFSRVLRTKCENSEKNGIRRAKQSWYITIHKANPKRKSSDNTSQTTSTT